MTPKPVLIVEDDDDIREILIEALQLEGYPLLVAVNGADGLRALRSAPVPPGLVLLDLMMPVLDGAGFLAALTEAERRRFPVLLITAAGPARTDVLPATAGLLKKPFDLDNLLELVSRYCGPC